MNNVQLLLVSINFGDYLATTLPLNCRLFQKTLVVTSPDDKETKQVCEKNGVEYLETTRHLDEGQFNKGKAINEGLAVLNKDKNAFICLTDADIVIPKEFAYQLPKHLSAQDRITGCFRYMCQSVEDWKKYLKDGNTDRFTPMKRGRAMPVGYFQLWPCHFNRKYPENVPSAGSSDWQFAKKFKAKKIIHDYVIHLSAGEWRHGVDYRGRQTSKWG